MDYYSAIKRNEEYAIVWMNFENIKLNERNQIQKATSHMIPFTWNIQNKQIQREKADEWLPGNGKGEMESDW